MHSDRTTGWIRYGGVVAIAALTVVACGGDAADTPATTAPSTMASTSPLTRGDAGPAPIDPGDGGQYAPQLDPVDFVDGVDHPYFPLAVGNRWVYEGGSDGEVERIEVVVTDQRREIIGISAVVVRDTVSVNGEIVEDTFDWFAQDRDGNVWYLGEDTREFEDGVAVNAEGAWEAGIDGALPGIVMPAEPAVGDAYRQEYYAGEAEDMARVVGVDAERTVPAGSYVGVLVTEDWTPLEPDVFEEKWYAESVGMIGERKIAGGEGLIELVEFIPGG